MCALVLGCLALAAFPYGAPLAERNRTESVATTTATSVASVPGTGMPRTDAVAVVDAREVDFVAFDEANWQRACQAFDSEAQAALTMRLEGGRPVWTAFAGGRWVDLGGVSAREGRWHVRIEADYSLGPGRRKVRYSVSRDGETYSSLSDGKDSWLPLGTDGEAFSQILAAGFGETGEITARSGERPLSDAVATVENVLMDYSGLSLGISVADAWGVEGAHVTLKDESGAVVATRQVTRTDGSLTADFSDVARPGETYRYDVTLTGSYNGKELSRDVLSQNVKLFTTLGDFGFRNGTFVNATAEGVTVSNGAFGTVADAIGTVTPLKGGDALRTTLAATLTVTGAFARAELPGVTPQFALTLMRREDGSCSWACTDGGKWTEVSGPGVSTTGGTYDIRVDLDYEAGTVAYSIRVGETYVQLGTDGRTVFDLPPGKRHLDRVAVGGGDVRELEVASRTVGPVPPTVAGDSLVLAGNAAIDLASLAVGEYAVASAQSEKPYHLSWTDGGGKYGVWENGGLVVKAGVPQNGMSSYASFVLGLDPEDESARPVLTFRPTADGTAFVLDLPDVSPRGRRETGLSVGYELVSGADVHFEKDCEISPVAATPRFTVPRESGPSRFYFVRIRLGD